MDYEKVELGSYGPFYYRPETSDTVMVRNNLLEGGKFCEYAFPMLKAPNVVLDIGANIGATSVLLSMLYPSARIYAFEPDLENFKLLELNTRNKPNVFIFNYGLGQVDGQFPLFKSNDPKNLGGFSLYHSEGTSLEHNFIEVRSIKEVIKEFSFDEIDLVKIDCEGAEYSILTNMDCSKIKFIVGELHGEQDWKLLDHLSQHFDIATHKQFNQRVFHFSANRKLPTSGL